MQQQRLLYVVGDQVDLFRRARFQGGEVESRAAVGGAGRQHPAVGRNQLVGTVTSRPVVRSSGSAACPAAASSSNIKQAGIVFIGGIPFLWISGPYLW